jgi:3-hydroxyacyl-CoA dehydrogenase/enoyl-CoA hydratase/3-hydroxybutyryl-CoA epimerase
MVEQGRLGRKSGCGFYRYDRRFGKATADRAVYQLLGVSPDNRLDEATIVDRCLLPMLNEAARCLDDGILRGARDGDIGAVYGIGFPPFRGGPFRYIDQRGADAVVTRLRSFAETTGARHEPAPALVAATESGRAFHAL